MLSPAIVTGKLFFSSSTYLSPLIIAEFVMRIIACIAGLILIYDSIKTHFYNSH